MKYVCAALVLSLLVLSGCSAQSSPTSGPSSKPSASPHEPEPTFPAEARGTDSAAAEAFVGFYLRLLDYAEHTGDVATLTKYSAESCEGCHTYIDYYRELYQKGGYTKGSSRTASEMRVVTDPEDTYVYVTIDHSGGQYRASSDAEEKLTTGGPVELELRISRSDSAWLVRQYAVVDNP